MKLHTIPIALILALAVTSCDRNNKASEDRTKVTENEAPSVSKHEELANEVMIP